MASPAEQRVFNPHGRRHYRRRYSLGEVRAGAVVVLLLAGVLSWVVWMGAHPDPELFGNADLLDPGTPVVERGVLPQGLSPAGFAEGPIAHFGADNLYEKINGRAGYFTSKGFEQLTFVSLRHEQDEALAIDIELYDMGSADNALGAYAGEKGAGIESERAAAGLWHRDRNALYLTHGQHYVRAIGSSEQPALLEALGQLRGALEAGLPAAEAELPWAHALFAMRGIDSGAITYHRENAFSFGFARGVYSALLADGETEVFVVAAPDEAAAGALAERFLGGFASIGERLSGEPWVKDRYLGSLAGARAAGALVCGVRGAPDLEAARRELQALCQALGALPEALREKALAGAAPAPEKGEVESAESEQDGSAGGYDEAEDSYE